MFLGGPLSFCKGLGRRFKETLGLDDENAVFPEYAKYSVAIGASLYAKKQEKTFTYESLAKAIGKSVGEASQDCRSTPSF